MKRIRPLLFAAVASVAILAAAAFTPAARADIVTDWNLIALEASAADAPQTSWRVLAITHGAIFDALNSIAPTYKPFVLTVPASPGASQSAAAAAAAHGVLSALYPAQKARLDGALKSSLANVPEGAARDDGIALAHLDSGAASLVFSGDTGPNDELWAIVNRIPSLKVLIVETAFSNKERQLAEVSKHLCPSMLAEELAKLDLDPEVWITHLKPGEIELTMQEIEDGSRRHRPRMLQNGQVFEF